MQFSEIKHNLLDDLVLVLYTPSGLHLFLHNDGRSRLTTTRVRTSCTLKIGSGQKAMGWREAEHAVFRKCQQIGQFIATLTTWDDRVLQALQERTQKLWLKRRQEAFEQHPFNFMTPTERGLFVQRVVQEVDYICHPGLEIASSTPYHSPCDWHRDGLRFECKSSRPTWSRDSWSCTFCSVKFSEFDILYLALDSPHALTIFKFGGTQYICSSGLAKVPGRDNVAIKVYGPRNETRISVAVDVIAEKLLSSGSQHVASVVW